jgi:hypothetical protein
MYYCANMSFIDILIKLYVKYHALDNGLIDFN